MPIRKRCLRRGPGVPFEKGMTPHNAIKPEPMWMRGVCVDCGKRQQRNQGRKKGKAIFGARCSRCHNLKHWGSLGSSYTASRRHKKAYCEWCGPEVVFHKCQLDLDHIDGDASNDDPSNFQTLCSNCHRLKTYNQLYGHIEHERLVS